MHRKQHRTFRHQDVARALREQAPATPPVHPDTHRRWMTAVRQEARSEPVRAAEPRPRARIVVAAAAAAAVLAGIGSARFWTPPSGAGPDWPASALGVLPAPAPVDRLAADLESAATEALGQEWGLLFGDVRSAQAMLDRCMRQYARAGS